MASATTIKFGDNLDVTDEGAGVIRVDAGGGSLPTVLQERFYGNAADQQTLPWTHASGDNLLDLTDPLLPLVIEAGTYIASFQARLNAASGTYMILDLELDSAGEDYDQRSGAPIVPNIAITSSVGVSTCATLAAGNDLVANVYLDAPGGTNVTFLGQLVKLL